MLSNGMITHYGLYWSKNDVFWGQRGNAGQLLGRTSSPIGRRGAPSANERRSASDFRDYKGVYALFSNFELVYVGQAGIGNNHTLFKRIKQHRIGPLANRWEQYCWFGVANVPKQVNANDALKQLEAICIAMTNPGFNKQSGAFKGAKQVYQVPHPDADGDLETRLARLLNRE